MPSRPLSADTSAAVKLLTRIDVEAIHVMKQRTEGAAAVARLTLLVPPARVDLVDEVVVDLGRSVVRVRASSRTKAREGRQRRPGGRRASARRVRSGHGSG
jgi:hypothetical protein